MSTPEQYWSKPAGMLPNSRFPLLVHRNSVAGGGEDALIARLRSNGWSNNWPRSASCRSRLPWTVGRRKAER